MAHSVLVVDDEKDLRELLEHNLTQAGFRVRTAADGRSAVESIRQDRPGLVLLDLMLPDFSGTEILKLMRGDATTRRTPVILLTARTDEVDRLVSFELGADDYITKPFSMRELLLRVRAVLKREPVAAPDEDGGSGVHVAGPIVVDLDRHTVQVDGRPIDLTVTEFKLLSFLIRSRGRVHTRDTLLSEVWEYGGEVMSRTVDTHIRRLREKLGTAASMIRTVRGVGYRIHHAGRG